VQSVVAGTSNTAGANLTITGSQGTGTGAGGSIIFQVAPAGSSGTAQNALATFAEITSTRAINLYNTTDVTTNYERGFLRWSSNQFQIGQEVGGTGVARAVVISGKSWTADSTDGTTATVTSSGRTDFNINATSANFAVFNFTRNNNQIWNYYLNNSTDDFSIAKVGVGPIITFLAGGNIQIRSNSLLQFSTDLSLRRRGAANLALGAADAAAPVAQTLSVQSVVAGTSNTAGANLTITGSQGTGTGAGGSIIFQVAPAGTAGTAQNALTTALTIAGNGNATFLSTSTTAIGTLNLTNALGLTYGGTGATTQAGAANAILPSQSTNSGKYLTTDGTDVSWGTVSAGGGATGGGTDEVFYENGNTITTNYTITSNKNAMSAGPITINSGVTVTVPSGSRWVIL
jgi:hypothetical protein